MQAEGLPARRRWPVLAALLFVIIACLYMFGWGPLVRHTQTWVLPGDIWGTFFSARYVAWGDIGDVYRQGTGLVTFPGIAVLLAPVALLVDALHLTVSISPIFLAHPSSWYLLGPADLLLGVSTIFATDRFARTLVVPVPWRAVLDCGVTIPLFVLIVLWGHPEDAVALTLALYAMAGTWDGRTWQAGWLWGAAIVMQPFAILLFPLALAQTAKRCRLATCVRAVIPSVGLLAIPLVTEWPATSATLIRQPNFPTLDHPTPMIAFATRLSNRLTGSTATLKGESSGLVHHIVVSSVTATRVLIVSAGPGRLIAVAFAVVVGAAAYRSKPQLAGFTWLCALALSGRCIFESVMVPFYLAPPCILIFLAAANRRGHWRLVLATLAGTAALVASCSRWEEWPYWLTMIALLGVGLACGWPGGAAFRGGPDPEARVTDPLGVHAGGTLICADLVADTHG